MKTQGPLKYTPKGFCRAIGGFYDSCQDFYDPVKQAAAWPEIVAPPNLKSKWSVHLQGPQKRWRKHRWGSALSEGRCGWGGRMGGVREAQKEGGEGREAGEMHMKAVLQSSGTGRHQNATSQHYSPNTEGAEVLQIDP